MAIPCGCFGLCTGTLICSISYMIFFNLHLLLPFRNPPAPHRRCQGTPHSRDIPQPGPQNAPVRRLVGYVSASFHVFFFFFMFFLWENCFFTGKIVFFTGKIVFLLGKYPKDQTKTTCELVFCLVFGRCFWFQNKSSSRM